jgi:putative hemolysin
MAGLFNFLASPLLGFIIQVVVVTALILLFGEIMPKIYASQNPITMARVMSRPILVMRRLFYPLSSILVKSTTIIDRQIARKGHNISIDDLSEALQLTTADNKTPEEEKKILKGIVKFGDTMVREIMRPRIDVTAVEDKTPYTDLMATILESGYSRIPVYHESFDNITGILYVKDLLPHLNREDDFNWQQLQRPAFFIPENKRIGDLLQEFQVKKIHLAVAVDEYGGTSGIVTLEDILEEIVGEINDEFDSETDNIHFSKIDDFNYIFEGKTLLNDFCKVLGIEDRIFEEAKGESDTLAGLMLELAGKIPDINEKFRFDQYVFQAETVDKRRIKRIRVIIDHKI